MKSIERAALGVNGASCMVDGSRSEAEIGSGRAELPITGCHNLQ